MLDPFCGSGTTLQAALDEGAGRVVGIDREAKYLRMCLRGLKPPPASPGRKRRPPPDKSGILVRSVIRIPKNLFPGT